MNANWNSFESYANDILYKDYPNSLFIYSIKSNEPDQEHYVLHKTVDGEYHFVYKKWHRNTDFEKYYESLKVIPFSPQEHQPTIKQNEFTLNKDQYNHCLTILGSISIVPSADEQKFISGGDLHLLEFRGLTTWLIKLIWNTYVPQNFVNVSLLLKFIDELRLITLSTQKL